MLCNSCYLFCKRLLQQNDADLHAPESIVHALGTTVTELQDKLHQCWEKKEIALLHTALFLGQQMLCDQAVTFPILHERYLLSKQVNNVSSLPRYKVLVYVEKEFGDLMSSVTPCKRVGRILYRTKCDPFLMLSNALGTSKSKVGKDTSSKALLMEQVADYLSESIHDLSAHLISDLEQAPVATSTFDLDDFVSHVHLNCGRSSGD